jgi:hypothetical protein
LFKAVEDKKFASNLFNLCNTFDAVLVSNKVKLFLKQKGWSSSVHTIWFKGYQRAASI